MRIHQFVPPSEQPDDGRIVYPTMHKLGIQARQSTKRQAEANHESYAAQTKAHLRKALRLGWKETDVLFFIENKRKDGKVIDASGTKRIDQRPTLQELYWYIEQDIIKAVLTRGVDRLFRHVDMIEPALFARTCREHHCIVITDSHVFDFSKPEDTKLFLSEAQAGADYISKHIKMMKDYKLEKAMRGEYDGRNMPIGYILDADKLFYVPYEPHAQVVRWLYQRFKDLNGNFTLLKRDIASMPFVFPFFEDGIHTHTFLGKSDHGYTISDSALKSLLTNVCYIGWWVVSETLGKDTPQERKVTRAILKSNHPAIVDESDFWYAFERLSTVGIDGERKPTQRPRYTKVGTIPVDALLKDIITGNNGLSVYVHQSAIPTLAVYSLHNPKAYYENGKLGSVTVQHLDKIIESHLLERLEQGKEPYVLFKDEEFECGDPMVPSDDVDYSLASMLVKIAQAQEVETAGLAGQLGEYKSEAASLTQTLRYGASKLDGPTVEQFSERLARLHITIEQLEAKQERAQVSKTEITEFIETLADVPQIWNEMGKAKQRRFLSLVCDTIRLSIPSPNWLQVDIVWRWAIPIDRCYIWQRSGSVWSPEDTQQLTWFYQTETRQMLLELFPTRSWKAIVAHANKLGLRRDYQPDTCGLHRYLSLSDIVFMEEQGIQGDLEKQSVWWDIVEPSTVASITDGGTYTTLTDIRNVLVELQTILQVA